MELFIGYLKLSLEIGDQMGKSKHALQRVGGRSKCTCIYEEVGGQSFFTLVLSYKYDPFERTMATSMMKIPLTPSKT